MSAGIGAFGGGMANKPYHGSAHRRLGTPVVAAANADPDHRCARCGMTRAEAARLWGADAARWVRGHKRRATQATSPADYQAEHAKCSAGEGADVRNRMSATGYTWP